MKTLKTEIKKQRIDILRRITELEPARCSNCIGSQMSKESLNCNCKASVEVRQLGKAMIALGNKRKPVDLPKPVKKRRKSNRNNEGYQEWKQVAIANGIAANRFAERVRKGESHESAATRPLRVQRKSVNV